MNLLTATGLTIVRDGRALLRDAHLELRAGEVQVLLGANGAGKSTLLRGLSGEWAPNAGRISLLGRPLHQTDAWAQARCRAVLPQHDSLSFAFTVTELVTLGRHAARNRRSQDEREIVAEVLTATGLVPLADRFYPELSGGERRRAQLARVLAQVWDVPNGILLLDEPVHSLDLAHQHAMLVLLRQMARRGLAVLASLHEVNLATTYADRLTLLKDGQVLASGKPVDWLDTAALQAVYGDTLDFVAIDSHGHRQWLSAPAAQGASSTPAP